MAWGHHSLFLYGPIFLGNHLFQTIYSPVFLIGYILYGLFSVKRDFNHLTILFAVNEPIDTSSLP